MNAPASRGAAGGGLLSLPLLLLFLLLVLLTGPLRTARGSCLSYGHSCWGAHGKRSGGGDGGAAAMMGIPGASAGAGRGLLATPDDTRWVLSRVALPSAPADLWRRLDVRALRAAASEAEAAGGAGDEGFSAEAARAPLFSPGMNLAAVEEEAAAAAEVEGDGGEEIFNPESAAAAAAAAAAATGEDGDGAVLLMEANDRRLSTHPRARRPRPLRLYKLLKRESARKLDQ